MVELPKDAFQVSHDGRRATLEAKDVCVLDSFQFRGPINGRRLGQPQDPVGGHRPARASRRGRGDDVAPTDPAAFLGRFAPARSTAWPSPGLDVGFSFQGRAGTEGGYAQLGPERNGAFLT